MKRMNCWTVVVLVSVLAGPCWADQPEPPQILVEGEAEVWLEPDYIEWVVDIRTNDKVPKIAREVNDSIYESLLDIADKADIDAEEVVSGEPVYEQLFRDGGGGRPDINRYTDTEVYRRVILIMRDMDEFDEMLDAVHPLGVLYVVRRKSTKYDEAVRRIDTVALKDAKQKAVAQADALGQSIGKAIEVEVTREEPYEGGLFGSPPVIEKDGAIAGPEGKVLVKAYAQVRFRLE
jgi:uncharacterized protein YggE